MWRVVWWESPNCIEKPKGNRQVEWVEDKIRLRGGRGGQSSPPNSHVTFLVKADRYLIGERGEVGVIY